MAEEKHRRPIIGFISAFFITAGLAGVAGAIVYAAREYDTRSAEQTDAIREQTTEIHRAELHKGREEKAAAYTRLTEAAAKIAAVKAAGAAPDQMQAEVAEFRALAWGPASITGGRDVDTALTLFAKAIDLNADTGQLQQLSVDLAQVCANDTGELEDDKRGSDYPANAEILARMQEIVRGPEAQHAAGLWLGLVDDGKYADSWKSASASLQSAVTQEQWETRIGGLRKALGAPGPRKFKGEEYAKSAPGAPEAEHIVLQYETSFAEKDGATETVTTVCDKDGSWRVSGYSVK